MVTQNIKRILKDKNVTQKELADVLGIQYQSVKDTLTQKSVTEYNIERYARALDVPAYILLMDSESIANYLKTGCAFTLPNNDTLQDTHTHTHTHACTCPKCGAKLRITLQENEGNNKS